MVGPAPSGILGRVRGAHQRQAALNEKRRATEVARLSCMPQDALPSEIEKACENWGQEFAFQVALSLLGRSRWPAWNAIRKAQRRIVESLRGFRLSPGKLGYGFVNLASALPYNPGFLVLIFWFACLLMFVAVAMFISVVVPCWPFGQLRPEQPSLPGSMGEIMETYKARVTPGLVDVRPNAGR